MLIYFINLLNKILSRYGYVIVRDLPDNSGNGLQKYISELSNYVTITKIIVPTERDKDQLLLASEYLHHISLIDSDYCAVNTLIHIYEDPDLIQISNQND